MAVEMSKLPGNYIIISCNYFVYIHPYKGGIEYKT